MKKRSYRRTREIPTQSSSDTLLAGAARSWIEFWFRPIDPLGLHVLRILTGVLLIVWLLPLLGHSHALFGLEGWFDQHAYRDAAALPMEVRPAFGWSILYLLGSSPLLLKAACAGALVVFTLFTLGIATRLTAIASWVMIVSFTVNPAFQYEADGLLVLLTFYLMVGYVLLHQTRGSQTAVERWLGSGEHFVFSKRTLQARPSVAANVALRLLQVHLAMAIVATGLHKLHFGDWWAGVALWYPLHPPLSTTIEAARVHRDHGVALLSVLSMAAYVMMFWQIAFPVFAWKPRWRTLLLGGAFVGSLGYVWLYELPLFGAVLLIGCLSYLSPQEWHEMIARLRFVTPLTLRQE